MKRASDVHHAFILLFGFFWFHRIHKYNHEVELCLQAMYLCQIERHRFIKYINHDTTNVWQLIQMNAIRCIVLDV